LVGQNRILVKLGLQVLSENRNPGVQALKEVAGIAGPVTPGQVGFRLGPRINAAGRLDSAKVGFDLLTSEDPARARLLAEKLDRANQERQALEERIVSEACGKVEREVLPQNRKSIFVCDSEWHLGVIGIVASRLVDRYYLPAIVGRLEGGSLRCSARSIAGLDLYETLQDCRDSLEKFGGHRQAAGLTLRSERKEEFWNTFDQGVKVRLKEEQFTPSIHVDAELSSELIEERLVEELEKLSPFGQGNPEPVFLSRDLKVSRSQRVGNDHLKLSLKTHRRFLDAIGFGMGNVEFQNDIPLSCVFHCQFNEFRGSRKIQLRLIDIPRN
jgi:single-stranded-DNA-specific exonuclease